MKTTTIVAVAAFVLVLGTPTSVEAAATFNFQFDDSGGGPDGTIGTPVIGRGVFVSPIDLGIGQYTLASLNGFSLSFTLGSDIFTTADIATPTSQVAVAITQVSRGERLIFTESGAGDGGPFGGALDLVNGAGSLLSFEPSYEGGHNLYLEFDAANVNIGNYLALSPGGAIPEPSTWAMTLLGVAGLALLGRQLSRARPSTAADDSIR